MSVRTTHVLVALILLVSLNSAQAQLFSLPALQVSLTVLDAMVKLFKFVSNVMQTLILMFCNLGKNDVSVKAAYYSLIVHRPNENVTSCLIGCLGSAAYNMKQAFTNITKIDPFFLVRRIVGEQNFQQLQYCAKKVQDDKCAMAYLFLDCAVNHFYSKFSKELHDFQDGIQRIVSGFPHLMQEYITKDGIPGGYFNIAMGLPTLIPHLLNFTTSHFHKTATTTMLPTLEDYTSTEQPYEIHVLNQSVSISTPLAYSKNPLNLPGIQSD